MSVLSASPKGNKRAVTPLSSSSAHLLEPTGPLLQFTGEYFQVVSPIDRGHRLVALMPTLTAGWIKIDANGQVVEQHLGLIGNGFKPPERKSLGNCDPNFWPTEHDPWQRLHHLTFEDMETGTKLTFVAIRPQEVQALRDLAVIYGSHRSERVLGLMPVIEPNVNSRGNPGFRVVGWAQWASNKFKEEDQMR